MKTGQCFCGRVFLGLDNLSAWASQMRHMAAEHPNELREGGG
jgi:hypothetical protein